MLRVTREAGRFGRVSGQSASSVGGEQRRLSGLFAGDRLVDVLAHVAGAGATLRGLPAGPEYIDRTARPGAHGSFDITFPDRPADAYEHGLLALSPRSCDLLATGR